MATQDLGRVVPLHKGEYSADVKYELNDVVSFSGSLYWHYADTETTGIAPTNTETWRVVLDITQAEQYIRRAETAASKAEASEIEAGKQKAAAALSASSAEKSENAATEAAKMAENYASVAANAAGAANEKAEKISASATQIEENRVGIERLKDDLDYITEAKMLDGKTKFDGNYYIPNNGTNVISSQNDVCRIAYYPCQPNTKYIVQKNVSHAFRVCYSNNIPSSGREVRGTVQNTDGTRIEITTDAEAKYLFVYYAYNETDENAIYESIKVTYGDITAKDQVARNAIDKLPNDIFSEIMEKNYLDYNAISIGSYQMGQNVSTGSPIYSLTDFLPVEYGKVYSFYRSNLYKIESIRFIAKFNKNKTYLGVISTDNQTQYVCDNEDVAYIRVTFKNDSLDSNGMMMWSGNPMRFVAYGEDGIMKKKYVDLRTEPTIHCYLPPIIYVGVGRTVELYNNLVCLEAEKYHLDWICLVGKVYKNKWSCFGESNKTGVFNMTLNIYNDANELVKSISSVVKVSANSISSTKNIVAIGDSLTNNKAWISEVQNLSENKIAYVGTRGMGGIAHEGRSGAAADWYNGNNTYTFDNNYVGSSDVNGESNPFWDGEKFSLAHYISTQSSVIGTPDAVQILLGTNRIADTNNVVSNIKTMVDSIVSEYPLMPIFVCNTIYRANQLLDSVGSDGYVSYHDYPFNADLKVMKLQIALAEAFKDYSNVYIVPLGISMDRDNNFGRVEVPVNPRLTDVKTYIPSESIHPQHVGYMQMADVMYSAYCGVLN